MHELPSVHMYMKKLKYYVAFNEWYKFNKPVETQMTSQRQCDDGLWPEANVGQQYRKGPDRLVHQM